MKNHLQEQKIPEISEIEEEKSLLLADLKKKYLDFAKIHFHTPWQKDYLRDGLKMMFRTLFRSFEGHEFLNKNTGKPIKVSSDGIREWWVKSRRLTTPLIPNLYLTRTETREHIISIQILDFFLENGTLIDTSSDYKGRDYIESASRFQSECRIDNKLYRVIVTTRKSVNDIDKLRYYSLENIEISLK